MSQLYSQLLYALATQNYLGRQPLLLLSSNPRCMYRAIKRAELAGHIKSYKVMLKVGEKNRGVIYYGITKNGLVYLSSLSETFLNDEQWVGNIPNIKERLRLSGENMGKKDLLRFVRVSGVAMMMKAAGFCVSSLYTTQETVSLDRNTFELQSPQGCLSTLGGENIHDLSSAGSTNNTEQERTRCETFCETRCETDCEAADKINPFENLCETAKQGNPCETAKQEEVCEAAKQEKQSHRNTLEFLVGQAVGWEYGLLQSNKDSDVLFRNAYEIKSQLHEIKSMGSISFRAGRIAGVVESAYKTMFVYPCCKEGMQWSKWLTQLDIKLGRAYIRHLSRYKQTNQEKLIGAMMVENAKWFEDLYYGNKSKRKEEEGFADEYDHFMIFPMTEEGVKQLDLYMHIKIEQYREEIIELAIESGVYQRNQKGFSSLFPLLNQEGTPMLLGVFMDAIEINRIRKITEQIPMEYGVICYDWQQDYYRRVLPEAAFMNIS